MKAILLIGLTALGTPLTSCADLCANEVFEMKQAITGGPQAILFQRNCGATTGSNLQVSLVNHGQELEGEGNVFIADDNRGAAEGSGRVVELHWESTDHLVVTHHPDARIYKQSSRVAGVRISYEHQAL